MEEERGAKKRVSLTMSRAFLNSERALCRAGMSNPLLVTDLIDDVFFFVLYVERFIVCWRQKTIHTVCTDR